MAVIGAEALRAAYFERRKSHQRRRNQPLRRCQSAAVVTLLLSPASSADREGELAAMA